MDAYMAYFTCLGGIKETSNLTDTKTTYQKSERFSKLSLGTQFDIIYCYKEAKAFCASWFLYFYDHSLIAFPEEFIHQKFHTSCNVDEKHTLWQFPYDTSMPSNDTIDSFGPHLNSSLNQCERYCGERKECWGCIQHCQDSCQWIAISECVNQDIVLDLRNRDISQKPGIYNTIKNIIFPIFCKIFGLVLLS